MNQQEERRVLDIAITAGRQPRRGASGRTIVATGQGEGRKKYLVLADGNKLTRAGQYWYEQTNQPKPDAHFDKNQQTVRKGDGDYIQTRAGMQRVRQLQPDGSFKITALGRKYYADKHTEYIVEIPVIIEVTDSKGRMRTRRGEHLPVVDIGLGRILASQSLTDLQRTAKIKNDVLRHLGGPTRAGRTVLQEISGQVFFYDREGTWLISAMGTTVDENGRAHTQAVLHKDLSEGDPLKAFSGAAFLPHPPECFLEEAFEQHDDCLCVPRQLAALTHRSMEEVCASFDGLLEEGWREIGVRPQEIERWCALHGHPYFLVRTGKLVKIQEPPEKLGKAGAYCIYDGHAFFYKSARTVSNWHVATESSHKPVLHQDHKSTLPEMKEWQVLPWPVEPGHFFTVDLEATRRKLLESGRSPKISLYKSSQIVALKYQCTQAADGCKGLCVIKQAIEHEEEIRAWLSRLPREVPWHAEGLPALTNKVLNELLRAERRNCPAETRKVFLRI